MKTFNTPAWEINEIGDKNSKELHDIDVSSKKFKGSQKKRLKRGAPGKIEKRKNKPSKIKGTVIKRTLDIGITKHGDVNRSKQEPVTNCQKVEKKLSKKQRKLNKSKQLNNKATVAQCDEKTRFKKKIAQSATENEEVQNKEPPTIGSKLSNNKNESVASSKSTKFKRKVAALLQNTEKPKESTLRQKMMEKLKASRFRYLNEHMYTNEGKEAQTFFNKDPDAFKAYHEGYRQQVAKWPLNPLDLVIQSIKKMPGNLIIADFGCGDGKLAKSVPQIVHSFDLVASNDHVIACDMANVPLETNSVDGVVFCLSLMGTNLRDYLIEANRVLKIGGFLKVAEVVSRFDSVDTFLQGLQHFGFKKISKNLSHNLFCFIDFTKVNNCKQKHKLPTISLHPCLYKKR